MPIFTTICSFAAEQHYARWFDKLQGLYTSKVYIRFLLYPYMFKYYMCVRHWLSCCQLTVN